MRINENARAAYRRAFKAAGAIPVTFRRVIGQDESATATDIEVHAIFRGYSATAPIGAPAAPHDISEGDRQFIVIEEDLRDAGFPLPLVKNDAIIIGPETFNIVDIDYGTRRIAGAIEGRARGV
jgi:hypothetical protein